MSPLGRVGGVSTRRRGTAPDRDTVTVYRGVRSGGAKLGQPAGVTITPVGPDLATRLRLVQRGLRSRIARRDALLTIVRAVTLTLEPAEVAEALLEQAETWVPAHCWAVVSSDQSGQLSVLADRGLQPDVEASVLAVARWVQEHDEQLLSADLRRDPRVPDGVAATVVAFPLSCRGRQIGALIGFDRMASSRTPRLAPAVLRAVRILLEPAATALDSALQLRRAEALSVTDDLTSLFNSRFLNQVLRRETKRASRSGRPLSLLFVDLDGFKSVNDSHGHLAGSRALVEAAGVIRGSARETDMVARFGGDEFALVLPDTNTDGAFAVGERIRERIAAHPFLAGEGLTVRLTASVGVATMPDAAMSAEGLVHAADSAMYRVKDRGKNGIEVATAPADK
jgi:diguanylate cyclase (GGDEF)-like protein